MRKGKWKNPILPTTFAFSLPSPFGFPYRFFEKLFPLPSFLEISFLPFKKRGGRWVGNYVCSSKNLRNNTLLFMCVFVGAFWSFLNAFTAVGHIWYVFFKYSRLELLFSWPNKTKDRQQVPPSYWARITNPWELLKPNKPKGQLSCWKVKILGRFTIIGQTLQDHILH